MHASNSILKTVIERVRAYMDEPETDAKYVDDFLVRHAIMPTVADVIGRLNMGADNAVVLNYAVTTVVGQRHYQLPPNVAEVWRVAKYDATTGELLLDFIPTSHWHPNGRGWSVEGNVLVIDPPPQTVETWTLEYVPSAEAMMHYATDGEVVSSTTFKLSAAPALGPLDLRANAYGGCMLRILGASLVEEILISSYDRATRVATLRTAASTSVGTGVTYEVVHAVSQELTESVAAGVALKICAYRKSGAKDFELIRKQYHAAIKTLQDRVSNMQMRTGKGWQSDTIDRQHNGNWNR